MRHVSGALSACPLAVCLAALPLWAYTGRAGDDKPGRSEGIAESREYFDPIPFESKCDLNADGTAGVADVQAEINQTLGIAGLASDLNNDSRVNVVDVQIVINAALSLGCAADINAPT